MPKIRDDAPPPPPPPGTPTITDTDPYSQSRVNGPKVKGTWTGGGTVRIYPTSRRFPVGRHAFRVRSIDRAGNIDPAATVAWFTVK